MFFKEYLGDEKKERDSILRLKNLLKQYNVL